MPTSDWSMGIGAMHEEALTEEGYHPVAIETDRGAIQARHYRAPQARAGVIWVGGVGGGWDTPAAGLYPTLALELIDRGISSLRVRYRHPTILEEAILDVLAGIHFLGGQGLDRLGLVGHSFGGAVVVNAAAQAESVGTAVTIASQSYGAEATTELGPRCSILLLHGLADPVLPAVCSEVMHRMAAEPKKLVLYEGAAHCLDEVAEAVHHVVREWLVTELGG